MTSDINHSSAVPQPPAPNSSQATSQAATSTSLLARLEMEDASLLNDLWRVCKRSFGPNAFQGLLLVIVALTSRTRWPVSARTVGAGLSHSAMGLLIEELLGTERVFYVTSQTERGLYSLGQDKRSSTSCLVCEGDNCDPKVMRYLIRLIRGAPNRSVDGSPTGFERLLRFDKRISVVVLRGESMRDKVSATKLISIRIRKTPDSIAFDAAMQLRVSGEPCDGNTREVLDSLRHRISATNWENSVVTDWARALPRIKDDGDTGRLVAVRSLVNVWRILQGYDSSLSQNWDDERRSIAEMLVLLDRAEVEDTREGIGPRAIACLRILQRVEKGFVAAMPVAGEAQAARESLWAATGQAMHGSDPELGPFTVQGVKTVDEFRGYDGDTIRLWIDELVGHGHMFRGERRGRPITYGLTEQGRHFETGRLSTTVRYLLGLNETTDTSEKQTFGASSPRGPV